MPIADNIKMIISKSQLHFSLSELKGNLVKTPHLKLGCDNELQLVNECILMDGNQTILYSKILSKWILNSNYMKVLFSPVYPCDTV